MKRLNITLRIYLGFLLFIVLIAAAGWMGTHFLDRIVHEARRFSEAQAPLNELFAEMDRIGGELDARSAAASDRAPSTQAWRVRLAQARAVAVTREAEISRAIADSTSNLRAVLRAAFVAGVVISVLAAGMISRSIRLPLRQLVDGMERLRQGDFTQRLKLAAEGEFEEVGEGVNETVVELSRLVGAVQVSGGQVANSSNEIASASRQQQTTASQIARTTMEIGATSNEITATA